MIRSTLSVAIATLAILSTTETAEAGKGFSIRVGGVQVSHRGGKHSGVRVGVGVGGFRPPIVHPPIHPPVIKPRPPICKRPPIVLPKPPIVIAPKPPIVITPPPVICQKPVILPCGCHGACHCPPAYPWQFGMSLQRVQTQFGIGLQVTTVVPGGAAAAHGLKVGDILLVAGGVNLSQATSNEHGVELVMSAVTPQGLVQLAMLDSLSGQLTTLTMAPTPVGGPAPAPAAASVPVALNAMQPFGKM